MSASTWPPDSPEAALLAQAAPAEEIPAAVLVPLFLAGSEPEPHVVLTRRRSDLRRHAGEISFPGGRKDEQDRDLTETALREAEEEIGLQRSHARVLATLPATSTFVTGYVIHPIVAEIPHGLAWTPSAREVDAVLELPIDAVREGRMRTQIRRRGIAFETDAYVVDEHIIWGATARIIDHLLERLRAGRGDGRIEMLPEPGAPESPGGGP